MKKQREDRKLMLWKRDITEIQKIFLKDSKHTLNNFIAKNLKAVIEYTPRRKKNVAPQIFTETEKNEKIHK